MLPQALLRRVLALVTSARTNAGKFSAQPGRPPAKPDVQNFDHRTSLLENATSKREEDRHLPLRKVKGISNVLSTHPPIIIMSNAELASSYAALILADDGIDITV